MSVKVSPILLWVDLEESGTMLSLALVDQSLRPASDMLFVLWGGWLVGS